MTDRPVPPIDPSAAGPSAAGPSAAGPSAAGPSAAMAAGAGESILSEHSVRDVMAHYLGLTESKRLLDQVLVLQRRKQFKTLCLLSCLPGEGKSFLALVLATGFVTLLNRKVLLVDAVNETKGHSLFTEKIVRPDLNESTDDKSERGGCLDLLSTRSSDLSPAESTDFYLPRFVDEARDDYDLIIYDTCAIRAAGPGNMDPVIIARGSDACLLVTSPKTAASRATLLRLRGDLARWELPIIGTVFNHCKA